jgi:hypothetical protein
VLSEEEIKAIVVGHLNDGEDLEATSSALMPRSGGGRGVMPAALVPLAIAVRRWERRRERQRITGASPVTLAPKMIMAITNTRLVFFRAGRQWKPEELLSSLPRDEIRGAKAPTVGDGWRTVRIDVGRDEPLDIRVPARLADDVAALLAD